jgi:hypothetical protein
LFPLNSGYSHSVVYVSWISHLSSRDSTSFLLLKV